MSRRVVGRPDIAALRTRFVLAGTAYALAMAAVAAWAAWPVYADPRFLLLAATAVLAGVVISCAATVWSWPGWQTTLVAVIGLGLLGFGIAAPPADTGGIGASVRQVATGVVTGWKDLVTVQVPVGTYRNLMMPALVVFLCGTLAVLRLAWRPQRYGTAASAVAMAMTAFGLLFGRTVVSGPLAIGPVTIPAFRELACGALALVLSVFWLSWRSAAWRRDALRRAADASGVRLARRRTGSDARRAALAAGMVVVAVAVGALIAPAVAEGRTREVLRSGTGPAQAISRAVTPLTAYRTNFTQATFTAPLFTVTAVDGPLPDSIRLATLSWYDGAAYAVAPQDEVDARFLRVPAVRSAAAGPVSTVRIGVEGLRGIWLPTFGSLQSLRFAGADAPSHADAFYYDAGSGAGVQADGLHAGETYEITASRPAVPALGSLRAPGDEPQVVVPESVKTWIQTQDAGTDGAGLARLVQLLRERGYLSHALTATAGADWVRALGPGYAFQPSTSGHSLARIDAMFRRLLDREASADGGSLVAAPGDDEQFAVAVALIAQQLGFPSRVVVGAHLRAAPGIAACQGGVCTGGDLAVWTEVRSSAGDWVPVEVTPQHTESAQNTVTRQRDPENPTDVRPQSAQVVDPPDPTRQESADTGRTPDEAANLDGLWAGLRIAGISLLGLLVVIGPFGAVLTAKLVRRRGRRGAPAPRARIEGGWEEYVDAAVDHGLPAPHAQTRTELATAYATPHAATLAVTADRAVFSDQDPRDDDAARFWSIVDDERRRMTAAVPLWRRVLAAVSLRSFLRGLPRTAPHRDRRRPATRSTAPGTSTEGRGRAQHATPAES
ncbi:transglutaminase [Microbacterium sp. SYP-A9085]|uniref:transglutaminase domain-containing protein n=1 Tax=Microbacterium sp. SYP-A9085 TaxID=2664454 RepID=UPI00129BEC4B|nr:transglutaminase domain-containing protein [Microbacterium sp. SYP-A9085]MRH29960.1 transglutaminase [Microbacterium sp. SYP-A9085]